MSIDRLHMAVLAGALTLAAATTGCGSEEASGNQGAADGSDESQAYTKVVNVETRVVEPTAFTAYVRLTGAVEAFEDVIVSSEESGVIERFLVDKGARVRRGQPIAKIDDEIISAQVAEARAGEALARERYERQRQLWEDEQIGSEIAFLQTKYDAESAAARLELLVARRERYTIASPITGVLDDRYVDAGELVAPGTAVARVLTVDRLKVVGGVPERFGPWVRAGEEARITFDVLPGWTHEGRIEFVGAAVDLRNRTFPVEILLDNPDGKLKPQMIANVAVTTQRLTDVIVVPQDVLQRTEDGYQAFIIVQEGDQTIARARPVVPGPSFENEVVIESGLEAGERLVVRGHQLVDSGDRVRVVGEGSAP